VSSHYILFFYKDVDNVDYRFVVLPSTSTAPADYAAIGAYDGHITLKAKPTVRAGMIFLPGTPSVDGDGVPTATLAASSTYKLYGAGVNDEVKSIDVKTGARGPESPFRVRRNSNLLTRIYVGKKYGIVPFSEFSSDAHRAAPCLLSHQRSGGSFGDITNFGVLVRRYAKVVNFFDMGGRGRGANTAEGVLLFLNSSDTSLNDAAKNLGLNNTFEVTSNNGAGTTIHLQFSDDNENQRSITNARGFATSPAVD